PSFAHPTIRARSRDGLRIDVFQGVRSVPPVCRGSPDRSAERRHRGLVGPVMRPLLAFPRSYWAGCGLVIAGGLTLSLGLLCLRAAAASDAWQYLFWRGIGFTASLTVLAAWRHAENPLVQMQRLGGFAWVSVLALVASQVFFVAAIKAGNTAEVFFLLSLAPLIAAILARPLLGERIGVLSLIAIAVGLGGGALMSGLSFEAPSAGWAT